jgi:hypothetical protein
VSDLESQLRTEVIRRSQEFSPSADLGDRIGVRVRRRQRQRRLVVGVGAVAVMAVVALGVILARPADEGSIRIGPDDETPSTTVPSTLSTTATTQATSTTAGPPATTATTSQPATGSTAPPAPSPGASPEPSIDANTPLSRSGIGPIRAGMTLRQAEAAAGVSITPDTSMGPGSTCITASIDGLDLWFVVALSGQSGEDPMDGVIGSVQGGRRTAEGVAVGDPTAKVNAIYGFPTRTLDYPYLPNGQVFVYESGGYAYSVTTDGASVVELESGSPASVANLEGCA